MSDVDEYLTPAQRASARRNYSTNTSKKVTDEYGNVSIVPNNPAKVDPVTTQAAPKAAPQAAPVAAPTSTKNSDVLKGQIQALEATLVNSKASPLAFLYGDAIKADEQKLADLKIQLNNELKAEKAEADLAEGQAAQKKAAEQAEAIAKQAEIDAPEQMRLQNEAAQKQASEDALRSSDAGMQQQIKSARTQGMSSGTARLAAAQNQGGMYQAARADEVAKARGQYSDALQRQMQGRLGAAGIYQGNAGQTFGLYDSGQNRAAQQAANFSAQQSANLRYQQQLAQQQQQALLGGAVKAGGYLVGSDRNIKKDIKENKLGDSLSKIKSYSYKYKGSDRPEQGVMAQDLEKGAMKPAVVEMPFGKAIDTSKLSTMNTGALAEHEKEIRSMRNDIQALIKELGMIPEPKKAGKK